MGKQRTITYLALALAVFLLLGAVLVSMGSANARYLTVAGWQMVLENQVTAVTVSSDVLEKGNIVLLNDLDVNDTKAVKVRLNVENGTATGRLICRADENYLTAQCSEEQQGFNQAEFIITLTPVNKALELTEPYTTTVNVEWSEDLWSIFQVTLQPVAGATDTPSEETGDAETGGDDTAGTDEEATETQPTQPPMTNLGMAEGFVSGMTEFDPAELLVLQLTVPTYCDRFVLGLGAADFPAMTRYSLDGGVTYTMLYDAAPLVIEPGAAQVVTLVLDLELAQLTETEMKVYAQAFYGDIARGVAEHSVKVGASLPELGIEGQAIILNEEISLTAVFPQNLGGAEANVRLSRKDGGQDRMPYLTWSSDSLTIETVGSGERARAGAYLMDVTWTYQGVAAANRQMQFYVNYTDYVQYVEPIEASTESTPDGTEAPAE